MSTDFKSNSLTAKDRYELRKEEKDQVHSRAQSRTICGSLPQNALSIRKQCSNKVNTPLHILEHSCRGSRLIKNNILYPQGIDHFLSQ